MLSIGCETSSLFTIHYTPEMPRDADGYSTKHLAIVLQYAINRLRNIFPEMPRDADGYSTYHLAIVYRQLAMHCHCLVPGNGQVLPK